MKILRAIGKYLSDWKNWLTHGLVGVGMLVLIIWVPVQWWIKLIAVAVVVGFNVLRMSFAKKNNKNNIIGETNNVDLDSEEIIIE